MADVKYIAPQGSCQYKYKQTKLYCPDIFGTYKKRGKEKRGFVIDCKHYHGRSIDKRDRKKLNRDRNQVRKYLVEKGFIEEGSEVKRMFVTSEGNGNTARRQGYTVIIVGTPGAPHWKTKLEEGFEEAMK